MNTANFIIPRMHLSLPRPTNGGGSQPKTLSDGSWPAVSDAIISRTSPALFVHTFLATWSAERVLRHCGHGIAVLAEANEL